MGDAPDRTTASERIEALEATVAELRATVERLVAPPAAGAGWSPPAGDRVLGAVVPAQIVLAAGGHGDGSAGPSSDPGGGTDDVPDRRVSRRGLLLGAAGVAAAGAAVVAGADPAAANGQGQSWTLGDATNTATAITGLTANLSGSAVAKIVNSSTTGSGLIVQSGTPSGLTATGGVLADSTDRDGVVGLSKTKAGVKGRSGVYAGAAPPAKVGVMGEADDGEGVQGVSNSGVGVHAKSTSGIAVKAESSSNGGVLGSSASGVGVVGSSGIGTGVYGSSNTKTGIYGLSTTGVAAQFESRYAQLQFMDAPVFRTPPTSDGTTAHTHGQVVYDSNGDLWLCTADGQPGTWQKLAGPSTAGALHLYATPQRVYDSRPGTQPAQGPKTPLAANEVRALSLVTGKAALVTVLLVNAAAGNGNFTIWSKSEPKPTANTLVWGGSAGRFAIMTLTAISGSQVNVSASAQTDLVLDVLGYYK